MEKQNQQMEADVLASLNSNIKRRRKEQEKYNKHILEIATRLLSKNNILTSERNITKAIDNMEDGMEYMFHDEDYISINDYKAMEDWLLESIRCGAFKK